MLSAGANVLLKLFQILEHLMKQAHFTRILFSVSVPLQDVKGDVAGGNHHKHYSLVGYGFFGNFLS